VITINAERNAVKPAVVLKLQDHKYVYQETIKPDTPEGTASNVSPQISTSGTLLAGGNGVRGARVKATATKGSAN